MEGLINDSLERLDHLEEQGSCSASLKDQIKTLKIEVKFLRTFFMCKKLKKPWADYLEDLFKKIEAVIRQDVVEVIHSLYVEAKESGEVPIDLDRSLFSMQENIELIKPEIHQFYHRISELRPRYYLDSHIQVKCIDYVLQNLKDLLESEVDTNAEVKKLINTYEMRLRFLRNSHMLTLYVPINDRDRWDLKKEVVSAAMSAALIFSSCWINKMVRERDLSVALKYRSTRIYGAILEASNSLASNAAIALLVDFIGFNHLPHLAELLSHDSSLEISMKGQLESLCEELKLLRTSLMTPTHSSYYEKSCLEQAITQVNKAARLIEAYVGNTYEDMIMRMKNDLLLPLPGRLKLISLFWIVDRVKAETSLIAPMKDQLETLHEDIRVLRTFFSETQKGDRVDEKFKDIHSLMDAMALEAGSAIYSFHVNEDEEGMAEEMSNLLPDLLEKIKLIKANMRKIYPHATSSNFSKTRGKRGTILFLKELNELLKRRAGIISHFVQPHIENVVKLWIENVQNELQFLISFLDNSEEQCIEIGELEALEICIMSMENEAKYATDPIFLREHPLWYCMLKFSDVMEEVKLIRKKIERINKTSGEMLSSQDNTSTMGEVIVGFEDEAQNIIERLIRGPEALNVLSIIGMGGLGKTTLAKKLYSDPLVVEYFDVRAICCISQIFQKRQVLLDILGQVVELTELIYKKTDEDLEEMLYKYLKGRRYLIVIDDIWDIKAWNALRRCFYDDCNGSRIMFTTRLREVASKVQERSIPHILRPFSDDESWELLQKTLFRGKRCPTEQLEIVKQIAKDCKGLPLAVVLMAGILKGKNKEEWKQVAQRLSRHTDGDLQNLSKEVLELSYKNLPEHLKPCFLYLGMFPEDKELLAKKLMWLWAAEGFVQKIEKRSFEDIAKDYLMDLIGRSLVIVAERGSRGAVKTFRIHDLLRSFSLAKAKEENFLLLLDGNDEPFVPPNVIYHPQLDGYAESSDSNPTTYEQYRLCIYSMLDFDKWPSSLRVCSLLHFAPAIHLDIISSYDATFIFSSFKFLNILDLGRLLLKDLNREIESLVHLRLLAVHIRSNSIPSSIANLRNLITFLVKGTRGEVALPNTIWSMVSLRHLHIDKRASSIWDKRDIKDAILDHLETLSTPILPYGTNSRDVMCSLPNLRKLKCIFTAFWSNFENCNYFPELDSLSQLESLKVFYYATKVSHGRLSFPSNLKKLTLSNFRLPWSDIATIGTTLPNLEVLKLLSRAFDGKQWETKDGEFPKLKYLKLEALNIEQWNVSSEDDFPVLEKLVVHRCKQLEEIPSSFGDINTLQMIEVKWCNHSVANSAKDIYQEQLDFGNEGLNVIIHPYPSDQGLVSSS